MARIFISYRREEASASAGRLHDRLREHFGRQNVFMDVDSIDPGIDFIEVIERTVGLCDVLIAFIGRQWLTMIDADGHRRIDNPEDFVRHEIATALKRNIRVIPVLIQGTSMPRAVELPEDLQPLTRRHALDLSDQHFHRDVNSLIEMLDQVLGLTPPPSSQPGASSTAMPHTEPTSTSPQEPALVVPTARSSYLRSWRIWMLACIITGILSALVYNATRSTRMSVYDLSGTWIGTVYYPEVGSGPREPRFEFVVEIEAQGKTFSGMISEPNTFGDRTSDKLYASLRGTISDDGQVEFTKQYDGTAGVSHSVKYKGNFNRAQKTIQGIWSIGDSSGIFEMIRQ